MSILSKSSIDELAKGCVSIYDRILSFYDEPANEEGFQAFIAAGGIEALIEEDTAESTGVQREAV